MRTAIIYYSYSGNTHRVANLMAEILKGKGDDVVLVRIRPLKEEKNFILQCRDAFLVKKPELYRTLTNLKDFDRVIIGSPVWAFKPAPAVNTYMDICQNISGKECMVFATYGSGAGKDRAIEFMKKDLEKKNVTVSTVFSFQQAEKDEVVREKIIKAL